MLQRNTYCELGNAVANVHLASTGFVTDYTRPVLDTPYLDAEQMRYATTLQKKIHAGMPAITTENGAY